MGKKKKEKAVMIESESLFDECNLNQDEKALNESDSLVQKNESVSLSEKATNDIISETSLKVANPKPGQKKQVDCIFYIYFGLDDSEFFTTEPPIFENTKIILNNAVEKGVLSATVLSKTISVEYNKTKQHLNKIEKDVLLTKEGEGGIIVKCILAENFEWMSIPLEKAELKLKELKLEMYEAQEQISINNNKANSQSIDEIRKYYNASANGRLLDL